MYSKFESASRYVFPEFEVAHLKRQLNAENYERFADFRINVLERARKEINIVTDMEMDFTPVKQGRMVKYIRFTVKLKNSVERLSAFAQADKALENKSPTERQKLCHP